MIQILIFETKLMESILVKYMNGTINNKQIEMAQ